MLKFSWLTIFLMGSFKLLAQVGNPFIQNFPPAVYKNKAYISSPQNWSIIQDHRGVMYISNTSGILEYDGHKWQLIKGTENRGILRLGISKAGRIYAGNEKGLGYLTADSLGTLHFAPFRLNIKGKYPVLEVKKILTLNNATYFLTSNYLVQVNGKKIRLWNHAAYFKNIYGLADQLFLLVKDKGLCVLKHNQVQEIPGGKEFQDLDVTSIIPGGDSSTDITFLVSTFSKGLFLFNHNKLNPIRLNPGNFNGSLSVMQAVRLKNGTFALATLSHGIIITDKTGAVKKIINKKSGLNDNVVLGLFQDREGGLWASLNVGLSRLDYPGPLTFLNETSGLDGIVNTIYKAKNKLYAGTSVGLFVLDETALVPAFEKLPGIDHEVWKVQGAFGRILITSGTGVHVLNQGQVQKITPKLLEMHFKCLYQSPSQPNYFYVGLTRGLGLITYHNGTWHWAGFIKGINHEVICLAEDNNRMLWASCNQYITKIATGSGGPLNPKVYPIQLTENLAQQVNKFEAVTIKGKVYFGTNKGIYSFNQSPGKLRADTTFGKQFASGTREAINLTEDKRGRVWLTSEFRTGLLRQQRQRQYAWDTIPLVKLPPDEDVWTIHADEENVLWLGTNVGIFRYDPRLPENYKSRGHTIIRRVQLREDSVVFNGAFPLAGSISLTQTPRFNYVFPHSEKSIAFDYAAPSYTAPEKLVYSYKLEGEDENWSKWTREQRKEFRGLDEGNYVFKVKSKNLYGIENQVSSFAFTSLPPFYRTWWAYTSYVILYGLVIWGFIKVKHRHLIDSKKSLEKLVHERTGELETEKKKSDDLLKNILPDETADELKLFGRAKAHSYETATVLFTDFKDFARISENLKPEELVAVIDFYFSYFDRIISKYNIEKIKTIGDAYMCAGGLPNPDANTPADVVRAALEILNFVQRLNPDNNPHNKYKFEIRIGIHSGPVVAGIVGIKKFAYDIWGDTVNTAARMESSGQEGKVNISGATYNLVKDEFCCTYRGKIEAKSKGEIDMYFVKGPRHNTTPRNRLK